MTESRSYNMVVSDNSGTCYVKLSDKLIKTDSEQIEELIKEVSASPELIKIFIFDLSQLSEINHKCYRPLALAQHEARNKQATQVVVIPPEPLMKKLLLENGLIRPREICPSLDKIAIFLKDKLPKKGQ